MKTLYYTYIYIELNTKHLQDQGVTYVILKPTSLNLHSLRQN